MTTGTASDSRHDCCQVTRSEVTFSPPDVSSDGW